MKFFLIVMALHFIIRLIAGRINNTDHNEVEENYGATHPAEHNLR